MNKIILIVFLIHISFLLSAQKSPLDFTASQNFSHIGSNSISNDGKYVFYTVDGMDNSSWLYLRSVNNNFQKKFLIDKLHFKVDFTEDSRWMLFALPGDSLGLLDLQNKREKYIINCSSFQTFSAGNGQWLAYQLSNHDLVLWNLSTQEKRLYIGTEDYSLSNNGKVLLINSRSGTDGEGRNCLLWIDMVNGSVDTVWRSRMSGYTIDETETQLAFLSEDTTQEGTKNMIWYYKKGMQNPSLLVDNKTEGILPGMMISAYGLKFSSNADKLFFNVNPPMINTPKPDSNAASVDVWSYRDQYLKEEVLQREKSKRTPLLLAVIHLDDKKVMILKKMGDAPISPLNEGGNDDFLFVSAARTWEGYSNDPSKRDMCLVNTKNGRRECCEIDYYGNTTAFSPGGKYVYWYDMSKKAYFTYDLKSKVIINITERITNLIYDELWDRGRDPFPYASKPIWFENDESVLICDRYDIWKLDPTGIKAAVNITNGYGRMKKIIFRYVYSDPYGPNEPAIKNNRNITLSAFNEINKDNGFFSLDLQTKNNPKELIMSPNVYYFPENFSQVSFSTYILKAKDADVYLLKRESASETANLVVTKDFKKFIQVSDLAPEKKYNWVTSELIHYKTFEDKSGAGILYKPENFDPAKKYPIIFYFYERLTDGLNKFPEPGLSNGPLNIPYFVSQGYLLFCPDIYYTVGQPGESVYDYVVSAAKMMSEKPFVDKSRMGIQGHSFGGYEVNYLISRTGIFAAACSAAGPTDLVSGMGGLIFGSSDAHSFYENEQIRLGTTLWQNQNIYIKNSPLFGADKVTTPLLMMHNKKDGSVPWSHGVEFFTALRRLGKTVWMLQYDNEGHTLTSDVNQLDYSIRLKQFFDHYLKGTPAHEWMTNLVPETTSK